MNYEIWHRIFIISLITAVASASVTVFLIIKYRFFSLIKSGTTNPRRTVTAVLRDELPRISATDGSPVKTEQLRKSRDNEKTDFPIHSDTVISGYTPVKYVSGNNEISLIINRVIIHSNPDIIEKTISASEK